MNVFNLFLGDKENKTKKPNDDLDISRSTNLPKGLLAPEREEGRSIGFNPTQREYYGTGSAGSEEERAIYRKQFSAPVMK